jgi:hypothetical protein
MALGIVSAKICAPISPSLPQAVKAGFSFCRCICLAENNVVVGYNFANPVFHLAGWGDTLQISLV